MFGSLEFWSFGFVSDFGLRISDLCLCKMVIAPFRGLPEATCYAGGASLDLYRVKLG